MRSILPANDLGEATSYAKQEAPAASPLFAKRTAATYQHIVNLIQAAKPTESYFPTNTVISDASRYLGHELWKASRAVEEEIVANPTREELDAKLQTIEARMDARIAGVDGKIDRLIERIDASSKLLESKLDSQAKLVELNMATIQTGVSSAKTASESARDAVLTLRWNAFFIGLAVIGAVIAIYSYSTQLLDIIIPFVKSKAP